MKTCDSSAVEFNSAQRRPSPATSMSEGSSPGSRRDSSCRLSSGWPAHTSSRNAVRSLESRESASRQSREIVSQSAMPWGLRHAGRSEDHLPYLCAPRSNEPRRHQQVEVEHSLEAPFEE